MTHMTPEQAQADLEWAQSLARNEAGGEWEDVCETLALALETIAARGQALNCLSADGVVDDLTARHPDQVRMEQLEDDVTWIKITVSGRDHIFHAGPVEYIGLEEEDDYDVHGDVDE